MTGGTATIRNRRGLHARAAAKLATLCETFQSTVSIAYDGQVVAGISIMGLMMLGAGLGAEVTVAVEGVDEHAAYAAVQALIRAGFHENE